MFPWKEDIEAALRDFVQVSDLAHVPVGLDDFQVDYLDAPHRPPSSLPLGKMAIYGFFYGDEWLKIGMVGPKSQARYVSQHYSPQSAGSTLAKSLMEDPALQGQIHDAGSWIKENCCRVNVLLDIRHGLALLALLESFLHARLRPRYER